MRYGIKTLTLMVVVSFIGSFALARPKTVTFPLKWTPNPGNRHEQPTLDLTGGIHSLRVEPFIDKRDKGKQIGENTEEKTPVPVTTDSDVAGFLTQVVVDQLKRIGLDIGPGDAERVLRVEVMELWVSETNRYNGTVRLKLTVTDARGKELWSASVGGVGENWGRSLKPVNYTETISNSVLDLVGNIVKNPGFLAAVKKTAGPTP